MINFNKILKSKDRNNFKFYFIIKEKAIKQLELERNDCNYFRKCLFCPQEIGNNRSDLLNHMSVEHNFNVGHHDNIGRF